MLLITAHAQRATRAREPPRRSTSAVSQSHTATVCLETTVSENHDHRTREPRTQDPRTTTTEPENRDHRTREPEERRIGGPEPEDRRTRTRGPEDQNQRTGTMPVEGSGPNTTRQLIKSPNQTVKDHDPTKPSTELRQWTSSSSSSSSSPAAHPTSPAWSPAWPPAGAARWGVAWPAAPPTLSSSDQLMWLQLVYTQHCYLSYHAALVAANSAPSPPPEVIGHQCPPVPAHQVVPAPPAHDLPANQNVAQGGALVDAGMANQNVRMNAGGGARMEDEDVAEHDWLDWIYSAARLTVLVLILDFDSDLSRLLLVLSTLLLLYLHTAGWFPFRRPQAQRPDHLQALEVQQNQQNQNRNPGEELVADRQGEGLVADRQGEEVRVARDSAMTAVLVPAHRTSVMWTTWVFFRTFFSSLIPEVPHV